MWWRMKWFTEKLTGRHYFLSLYLMPSLSHFSLSPKPFFLSTSFFILFNIFWFYRPSLLAFSLLSLAFLILLHHCIISRFPSFSILISIFLTSLFFSHLPHIFSYFLQISRILSHVFLHLSLSWFILLCIGNLLFKCLLVNIFIFFLVFLLFFFSFFSSSSNFFSFPSFKFFRSFNFPPLPVPFLLLFPFIPIRFIFSPTSSFFSSYNFFRLLLLLVFFFFQFFFLVLFHLFSVSVTLSFFTCSFIFFFS